MPCCSACAAYLLWPASLLPVVDKGRGSKSVEVQRVWEVSDERLQLMFCKEFFQLDRFVGADDVSKAWLVWSRAAEAALVEAYRFSGGPLPSGGLVLGRESASFVILLMCMMLRMFSCIVMFLLPLCLI